MTQLGSTDGDISSEDGNLRTCHVMGIFNFEVLVFQVIFKWDIVDNIGYTYIYINYMFQWDIVDNIMDDGIWKINLVGIFIDG